jgi:hypothetical protein
VHHWLSSAALGGLAALALASVASRVHLTGPPALGVVLAALAAVGATAGLVGAARRRRPAGEPSAS